MRFRLATIVVCRFIIKWQVYQEVPSAGGVFDTVDELRLLQRQNIGAAKIGRKTDNTVAESMAPVQVAAKKTQIVVSKPVIIYEEAFFLWLIFLINFALR